MSEPFIIETVELRKHYERCEALRGLNLQVPRGSIYGFLGSNGPGKTTTIKLLLGMARPTSGRVHVFGLPGACLFLAGAVFFSLALLLSTVFSDLWRPLLMVCAAVVVLALAEAVPGLSPYGVFRVMSAEVYFRGGGLPWLGLFASVLVSAAMLYGAVVNIARQDF